MLFQSAPPDTSRYMIAGYAVFTLIMVIYLASLYFRRRNLEQDMSTLQSIAADTKPRPGVAQPTKQPAARAKPRSAGKAQPKRTARKATKKK